MIRLYFMSTTSPIKYTNSISLHFPCHNEKSVSYRSDPLTVHSTINFMLQGRRDDLYDLWYLSYDFFVFSGHWDDFSLRSIVPINLHVKLLITLIFKLNTILLSQLSFLNPTFHQHLLGHLVRTDFKAYFLCLESVITMFKFDPFSPCQ